MISFFEDHPLLSGSTFGPFFSDDTDILIIHGPSLGIWMKQVLESLRVVKNCFRVFVISTLGFIF